MPSKISKSVKSGKPLYKGTDYTNATIGDWTVLGFSDYRPTKAGGNYRWKCRCSCGKEKSVGTSSLLYGRSTSCLDCKQNKGDKETNPNWKGYGEVSGTILQKLKTGAVRGRTLEVEVDCKFLHELWLKQDRRCVYSGRALELNKTASVDRIDSTKGYTKDNVQWVHVDVNRAKWTLTDQEFINLCSEIHNYRSAK